jgi:hypothetical protein
MASQKEARPRGFPSPSLGGFSFIVSYCDLNLSPAHSHGNLTPPLLLALVCRIPVRCDVRFGSLAALRPHFSSTADSGGKVVVRPTIFFTKILNVCFHQKRSFDVPKIRDIVRLLSAISGHSISAMSEYLVSLFTASKE